MPKRLCLECRCGNEARYRGRCAFHSNKRERSINRAGRSIYSTKRWAMTRKRKLSLNSICERCDNAIATDVHHKHGVEKDPWSMDGLEALCHRCHSQLTRSAQVGEGRGRELRG